MLKAISEVSGVNVRYCRKFQRCPGLKCDIEVNYWETKLFVVGGVERLLGGSFGKVLRSSGVRCWEGPRDFWEAPVERPVKGLAECTHIYTSK